MGGAYDALPELYKAKKIDPQKFVDKYVETGNRAEAYKYAGGEAGEATTRVACSKIMSVPEVQQAIAERSAQRYFELAPTAISVLEEILKDTGANQKVRATIAMSLVDKLQVEAHQKSKESIGKQIAASHNNLADTMNELNEFIRKNPEWASKSAGSSSVIEHDAGLSGLEEHSQQ